MVRHDMPLPLYDTLELDGNGLIWKVTCVIEALGIEEVDTGKSRREVRELVAEKVLGVVGDMGLFDDSADNKVGENNG